MQSADVAREYLKDAPNVTVLEMPINDGWTRDWGPSVSPPPPSLIPKSHHPSVVSQYLGEQMQEHTYIPASSKGTMSGFAFAFFVGRTTEF